jgi:hypothetical protein
MMVQLNLQPKKNCWDTLLQQSLLVLGIMMEQQPAAPEKQTVYFTFNNSTCTWDNDGTAKPVAPEKVNCWDTFTFNNSTCTWDNDGTLNLLSQQK